MLRPMLALAWGSLCWLTPSMAQGIPDIPEEVLRAQPSLRSRSTFDNTPLTPTEQAQAQESLRERTQPVELAPEIQQLIFLLRVRQVLLRVFPPRSQN